MDSDPSDFLSRPPRAEPSIPPVSQALLRRGWGIILLPLVALIPIGVSLWSQRDAVTKAPKSYSQAIEEEETEPPTEPSPPTQPVPSEAPGTADPPSAKPGELVDAGETTGPGELDEPGSESDSGDELPADDGDEPLPELTTITHVVRGGDTLSEVAEKYGVESDLLAEVNDLPARDTIFVGQELTVPGVRHELAKGLAMERTSVREVTVEPGDSLFSLARGFGVSAREIARINDMSVTDPIRVGDALRIPLADGAPATGRETTPPVATVTVDGEAGPDRLPVSGLTAPSRSGEPRSEPKAGGNRPVVLGPRAEPPAAASKRKAVVLGPRVHPPRESRPRRTVHLGPPVERAGTRATSGLAAPGEAADPPHRHRMTEATRSRAGRAYPDEADYEPVEEGPSSSSVHTASAQVTGQHSHGSNGPSGPHQNGATSSARSANGLISYRVQPFDTLASIARAHDTSVEILMRLNGISTVETDQTILLPIHQSQIASSLSR